MRALRPADQQGAPRGGSHRGVLPPLPAVARGESGSPARPSRAAPLRLDIPGDKSVSHRALLLGALAAGESRFTHLNRGSDVGATAGALIACGAELELEAPAVRIRGGALRDPAGELDLANSGTGVRLLAGLLAGAGVRARLTGDASLRSRPMDRVVEPLRAMGADVVAEGAGMRLPLAVTPAPLRPLAWTTPVPSAQVKSCLLLAGAAGGVEVSVREPARSRDHTERLLSAMGADVVRRDLTVTLRAGGPLRAVAQRVPGDLSSAAFFLALAALVPGLDLELRGVGVNPGRTAILEVLAAMGGEVRVQRPRREGGEPVADLRARHAGELRGVDVAPELAPRLIDEVPVVAVLAARASGVTRIRGVGELRVKESDRLAALVDGLRAVGVEARVVGDGLEVRGSGRPPRGAVDTRGDHRVAMAFTVLGRSPGADVTVSETASIATSFPEFPSLLAEAAP